MTALYLDTEDFSTVDIKAGLARYATGAEIILLGYAIDDAPAKVLDFTDPEMVLPDELTDALATAGKIVAHGSMFDRTMCAVSPYPELRDAAADITRWFCTMAQAYQHALPGSLDKLCSIFRIPQDLAKAKDGRALIQRFCKPQGKNVKLRRCTRETHPAEWQRFADYCRLDVEAMRAVHKKMPMWNCTPTETELWRLDQEMNARGFQVDMDLVHAAIRSVERAKLTLKAETHRITDGALMSTTQRDRLLELLQEVYGVTLPDLTEDTIERRLNDPDLPQQAKDLLLNRLQASTASVSKYKALERCVSADGRLRHTIQFCGAGRTGRDAGRLFQPQNLKRPSMKPKAIAQAIEMIKCDGIDLTHDNVMAACSDVLRGVAIATPGKKLVIADLSNIEGRATAYLAGEAWKLDAFRAFDAGIGPDLYKLAYAKSFNVSPESVEDNSPSRQIGKIQELFLGFGGGAGAFMTGAETYRIDLDAMTIAVLPTLPAAVKAEAVGFWEWARSTKKVSTYGLSKDTFVACDSLKRLWRQAHPAIVDFWSQLNWAAVHAIRSPGQEFAAGKYIVFQKRQNWLTARLPSGRILCYPSPAVEGTEDRPSVSYMGVNSYTKQWCRLRTFGGKFLENMASAFSRDVLFRPLPQIKQAGYDVVMKVHDELVTEAPDTPEFNVPALVSMMCAERDWHRGLPLAAKGVEGYRYSKE